MAGAGQRSLDHDAETPWSLERVSVREGSRHLCASGDRAGAERTVGWKEGKLSVQRAGAQGGLSWRTREESSGWDELRRSSRGSGLDVEMSVACASFNSQITLDSSHLGRARMPGGCQSES